MNKLEAKVGAEAKKLTVDDVLKKQILLLHGRSEKLLEKAEGGTAVDDAVRGHALAIAELSRTLYRIDSA